MAEEQKESKVKRFDIAKILGVLMVVANLTVMIGGTTMVYVLAIGFELPSITEHEEASKLAVSRDLRQANPIIYKMDRFTVNLDGKSSRFIRTELSFEMLDEKGFEEIVTLGAEARDAIIRILNRKTFRDLETIQGKLFLKDEIATKLNVLLKEGLIKEVYFGEFLVQ